MCKLQFSASTGFYFLRYLPHGIFIKVFLEVVEKSNNFFILFESIRAKETEGLVMGNHKKMLVLQRLPLSKSFHVHHNIVLLPSLRKIYELVIV